MDQTRSFNVTWVNPCFLEYRIPVYRILNQLLANRLTVICSQRRMKDSICKQMSSVLGDRFVALPRERLFSFIWAKGDFANTGLQIPFQPRLSRTIMGSNPNLIISEGFFQWSLAALRTASRLKIPLVLTYERTPHTERNSGLLRLIYRRLFARYVEMVCCNGALSKEYCQRNLKIPEERIVTGVMAADTEGLAASASLVTDDMKCAFYERYALHSPVFLFVGQLTKRKGVYELLQSWEIYQKNTNQLGGSLLIVGDGPEAHSLKQKIQLNKTNKIHLLGNVQYSEIAFYYSIANVLVMPTLEDNWSLVIPEAMTCKKPILCSIYNGCWPELVKCGINGWTFDPLIPIQLAELFDWCAVHFDTLDEMGDASRKINQDFSPQRAAESLYRACCLASNLYRN